MNVRALLIESVHTDNTAKAIASITPDKGLALPFGRCFVFPSTVPLTPHLFSVVCFPKDFSPPPVPLPSLSPLPSLDPLPHPPR